jgi:hypothetical protein
VPVHSGLSGLPTKPTTAGSLSASHPSVTATVTLSNLADLPEFWRVWYTALPDKIVHFSHTRLAINPEYPRQKKQSPECRTYRLFRSGQARLCLSIVVFLRDRGKAQDLTPELFREPFSSNIISSINWERNLAAAWLRAERPKILGVRSCVLPLE